MIHGTETGYCYHRCRCPDCTRASTIARRGRVKIERRVGKERGAQTRFKPADRDQTLDWLRTVPAYRELIRQRVSDAQKRHHTRDLNMLGRYWRAA